MTGGSGWLPFGSQLPKNRLLTYYKNLSLEHPTGTRIHKTHTTMSKQSAPVGQDWDYQNAGRGGIGGGKRASLPTSARELERAKAAGLVTTQLR
jgi:hypothetical protein